MENGMDWLFWAILIIGALAFLYVPQFLARRRQKKREEDLAVGDHVMTIGGLIGTITYIDFEDNIARVKIAEDVEIQMVPGAISGKRENGTSAVDSVGGNAESSIEEDTSPEDEGSADDISTS